MTTIEARIANVPQLQSLDGAPIPCDNHSHSNSTKVEKKLLEEDQKAEKKNGQGKKWGANLKPHSQIRKESHKSNNKNGPQPPNKRSKLKSTKTNTTSTIHFLPLPRKT